MKNLILPLLLCAILSACAVPGDTTTTARTLISFEEISNEITVSRETLAVDEPQQDTLETTVAAAR